MKSEGRKRFLTLKNVQVDQAGEVSYQALNAVTTAMLSVKGTTDQQTAHLGEMCEFRTDEGMKVFYCCRLFKPHRTGNGIC